MGELETLSAFSDVPAPAVSRVVFSPHDMQARAWLKGLCKEAGLTVREDAIGNLFARWEGTEAGASPVGTGSHTDAIPYSGRYDGTVGVLGGLEAIRTLQRAGVKLRRPLELLMFTSEEPTRWGIGCLGSRLLAGAISLEKVAGLRDGEKQSVEEVRSRVGFAGDLAKTKLPENYYSAFVELHIEQGPLLEAEKIAIGVVKAIAAPSSLRIKLDGEGGHAGAVLMPVRHDALCAAAEITLLVENAARNSGGADSVGTTGVLRVHPGAINSIPSKCELEIDIRDIVLERRDAMVAKVKAGTEEICARRGVKFTIEMINADPPCTCDPAIVSAAIAASEAIGVKPKVMVSRAYHDSLFMSRLCPTGMIFIPCLKGVSHRPDEYSSPEEIRRGVEVLARTMATLAT